MTLKAAAELNIKSCKKNMLLVIKSPFNEKLRAKIHLMKNFEELICFADRSYHDKKNITSLKNMVLHISVNSSALLLPPSLCSKR